MTAELAEREGRKLTEAATAPTENFKFLREELAGTPSVQTDLAPEPKRRKLLDYNKPNWERGSGKDTRKRNLQNDIEALLENNCERRKRDFVQSSQCSCKRN